MQKLRVHYAKRGRLRFSSTRDFQRALERALRRAEVPMAFSAGFHPHPRISYANAAPTGTASEAEYFELQLRERRDPAALRADLDGALPDGLDIIAVAEALPGALADRLAASVWRLEFADIDTETLQNAVGAFLDLDRAEVTRMMKQGPRTFDVREAVLSAATDDKGLRVVIQHMTPLVRPDDLLQALSTYAGLNPTRPPLVTRLSQGPLAGDGTVGDPLTDSRSTDPAID
ncbi:radical SAM-linked protein [Rudaeicoccus suwonensis]|uniref:Radical SAM-linked protein n=1 Tax=Rudaeicoccus suwonensis TaxID=657409 RepID=A0A561E9L3_9MICO|nr:radical SAM-linked protein [Rudaeicoccus suwonensis]